MTDPASPRLQEQAARTRAMTPPGQLHPPILCLRSLSMYFMTPTITKILPSH